MEPHGPALVGGTLPWTFSLLRAAKSLPQRLFSLVWWRRKLKQDQWVGFLALWVFVPLGIFCLSRSRLPLYVLPLFVPLALTTGRVVGKGFPGRLSTCLLAAWLIGLVVLKWGASQYPYRRDNRPVARAIAAKVAPLPSEILFVDSMPFWGLGFYLRSEVERVVSTSTSYSNYLFAQESLARELDSRESGTLILAKKEQALHLKAFLNRFGYGIRNMEKVDSWVLLSLATRADRKNLGLTE